VLQVDHQVGDGVTGVSEDLLERAVRERRPGPPEPTALGAVGLHEIVDADCERQDGVRCEDPGDPIGVTQREPGADGAAPVTEHQGDVREVERVDEQRFEIEDVFARVVRAILRCLALAEAHVVGNDHAVVTRQRPDHVAPLVAPGGLTMQHDDRLIGPFGTLVDIVLAEAGRLVEAGGIGPRAVERLVSSNHGMSCLPVRCCPY
jgi:hypothetical protein